MKTLNYCIYAYIEAIFLTATSFIMAVIMTASYISPPPSTLPLTGVIPELDALLGATQWAINNSILGFIILFPLFFALALTIIKTAWIIIQFPFILLRDNPPEIAMVLIHPLRKQACCLGDGCSISLLSKLELTDEIDEKIDRFLIKSCKTLLILSIIISYCFALYLLYKVGLPSIAEWILEEFAERNKDTSIAALLNAVMDNIRPFLHSVYLSFLIASFIWGVEAVSWSYRTILSCIIRDRQNSVYSTN